jgi:hypothetical protein
MNYPQMVDHRATVEPVPRRIRGYLDNMVAFHNEDVDLRIDGRLAERPGRAGHRVS